MNEHDNTIAKIKKLLAIAECSNNKEEAKNAFSKAYNYMKALNIKFEDIFPSRQMNTDSYFYKNKIQEISLRLEQEINRREKTEDEVFKLKKQICDIKESYEKEQFWREQAEKKHQEALLAIQSNIIFRAANYIYTSENKKSKVFLLTIVITVFYLICTMCNDASEKNIQKTINTQQAHEVTDPTLLKKLNALSKKDRPDTINTKNTILKNNLSSADNKTETIISRPIKNIGSSININNTQPDDNIVTSSHSSIIKDIVKKHSVTPSEKIAVAEFSDASTIPRICTRLNKVTHKSSGGYLYRYFTFELSSPTLLVDDQVTKYYKIIRKIKNGWYEFEGGGNFNFLKDGTLVGMSESGHKYRCFASEKEAENYFRMMNY
ncbi:DUF2786 domain-containing protein [Salmonella enterica subsp. enterica]|nr:DUF2786 domain-containing protein [Salmonella enterica subsp. enterica]